MRRSALLIAAASAAAPALLVLGPSSSAWGAVSLWADSNGAGAGFGSGAITWDEGTTLDWNTNGTASNTTAPGAWNQGSTDFNFANFSAAYTATVNGTVNVGGISFNTGATTITSTSALNGALNFGSSPVTISLAASGSTQAILVPITGSGDMTISETSGQNDTMNLEGSMAGFNGNLTVSGGTDVNHVMKLQLDSQLGDGTKTITLSGWSVLSNTNQALLPNGTLTSFNYTVANPIIISGDNALGSSAIGTPTGGPGVTTEMSVTYAGTVSGTGDLWTGPMSGTARGAVVLGATPVQPQYSYSGKTYLSMSTNTGNPNNYGITILGADNILPSGTDLVIGTQTANNTDYGPFDMNGHNLTIGALENSNGTGQARIYNTHDDPSSMTTPGAPNAVTLTINGGTSTSVYTFSGIIGSTTPVGPYNTATTTYGTHVNIASNISIVKAGSTTEVFSGNNLYTGTTTINGGTLVLGKTFGTQTTPGTASNTLVGDIIVNSGGTLLTTGGSPTAYWAGTAGSITNSGIISPGGSGNGGATTATTIGGLQAVGMTVNNGSHLQYDVFSKVSYDTISLSSALTLDGGTHNIDIIGTPGSTGFFTLASFSSLVDPNFVPGTGNVDFTLTNTSDPTSVDHYSLVYNDPTNPTALLLHIQGGPSVYRWDANPGTAGDQEGSGTWDNSTSNWIDTSDGTQHLYDNTKPILIGDDTTQAGGVITLAANQTVGGGLTFNPIQTGSQYTIDGGGAGHTDHTLTVAGGVSANNNATINAPVSLSGDQTWIVATGNTLTMGQTVSGSVNLSSNGAGTTVFAAAVNVNSYTQGGGTTTFAGNSTNIPTVTMNAGTMVLSGNNASINTLTVAGGGTFTSTGTGQNISDVEINGGATAAFNGSGGNVGGSGININAGTLSVGDPGALGPESTAGLINMGQNSTVKITAPMTFSNDISSIAGSNNWNFDIGANAVTFAGSITLHGNVDKFGTGDWTITNNNTSLNGGNGIGILIIENPSTLHLESAAALGTENFSTVNQAVTIDVGVGINSSFGAVRNDSIITKTGLGTITIAGSTGQTAVGANSGLTINQGAVEMDTVNSLGGSNGTVNTTTNSPNPQMAITINSGGELITKFNGSRQSKNINLAGGIITLSSGTTGAPAGDTEFAGFQTNGTNFNNFGGMLNVTGTSLIRDQAQSTSGNSNNLQFLMPVNINSGAVLTLEADNTAGNYEQAGVVFRGVDTVNQYPTEGVFLQNGTQVIDTGTGDILWGGTGRGVPIVATGGGAGTTALVQLGSHSFMRDAGSADDTSSGTASTKLVILNNANLRFEAPMNATYNDPANNPIVNGLRDHDGTTGLFGVNTTSTSGSSPPSGYTQIANGFTVLSPNRAHNLSRIYQPTGSSPFTPAGTLTLAATDAVDTTNINNPINVGPSQTSQVTLALDNAATSASSKLTYYIDGSADSGNFQNFAGLVVSKSNAGSGAVKAQLLSTTRVPSHHPQQQHAA